MSRRDLQFNLTVAPSAELQVNPEAFYSKAYLSGNMYENFRTVPGVKYATKLATTIFDDLTKPAGCDWSETGSTLSAEEFSVCPLDAMVSLCQYDLEQSFVSLKMARGDTNWQVGEFLNYFWDTMAMKINEEIQIIAWKGDTSLQNSSPDAGFIQWCDGLEKILANKTGVIDVTGTIITPSNVIAELNKVYLAIPTGVLQKPDEIRFHVSAHIYRCYLIATATLNTLTNITVPLAPTYLGLPMVVHAGMSDNKMTVSRKDNYLFLFDGEGDPNSLNIVDMNKTAAERKIRANVGYKIGFGVVNPLEIVYYA
jgi:hypothetical protein